MYYFLYIMYIIVLIENSYWQLKLPISFPEHFFSLFYQSIHPENVKTSLKALFITKALLGIF